jgi:hypothetical protein
MSNLIRSFNIANSVAFVIGEAKRQIMLKVRQCSIRSLHRNRIGKNGNYQFTETDCFLPKSSLLCMTFPLLTFSKRDDLLFINASILRTVAKAASISKCRTKLASNCLIYQLKTKRDSRYRLRQWSLLEHSFRVSEKTDVLC